MFRTATIWQCFNFKFGRTCWGENASKQDKSSTRTDIKKARGVVGRGQENIDTAYHQL